MEKQNVLLSGFWNAGIELTKKALPSDTFKINIVAFEKVKEELLKKEHDVFVWGISSDESKESSWLSRLQEIHQAADDIPVVIVAESGEWSIVAGALKRGAADWVGPPCDSEVIFKTVLQAARLYRLTKRIFLGEEVGSLPSPFVGMIGKSQPMKDVFKMISAVAKSNATVLISGNSGTGKELVAKAIHKLSDRSANRFVDLNCGAIPKDLLENELFGHEKGAFTGAHARYQGSFETAHRGSLFLDEISEMDPLLQVKLLRVLQERSFMRIGGTQKIDVDVRIVAATNRNLASEISQGRFREDLFYRLNVVNIMMPSLNERREDIPLLAKHFLDYFSSKNNRIFVDYDDEAMEAMINYDWPGNVRELENTIERVVVLNNASQVKLKHLPKNIQTVNRSIGYSKEPLETTASLEQKIIPLEELERQAIELALLQYRGNVSVAAKKLEIGQATLYRKIKKFGFQV